MKRVHLRQTKRLFTAIFTSIFLIVFLCIGAPTYAFGGMLSFNGVLGSMTGTTVYSGEMGSAHIGIPIEIFGSTDKNNRLGEFILTETDDGNERMLTPHSPDINSYNFIVIQSGNGHEFNFEAISFCDYMGSDMRLRVEGIKDGVSTGSVNVTLTQDFILTPFNSGNGLTPSVFQNVDRIEISISGGGAGFGMTLGFNHIQIGHPVLPTIALTADTTDNSVDNDLDITFGADATFEGAITGVTYGGQTLTSNQYTVSSGKITLHPSAGDNLYLRTPGTANVVVHAPGYNSSTVSQTINAGAVAAIEVTTEPVVGGASGDLFGTQPIVRLKDQYGNLCSTGVSATDNVVASAKSATGTWSIGGTTTRSAVGGVVIFTDLTCTLTTEGTGYITFTSGVVTVDSNGFTIPLKSGKVLTADTTDNSVDNDLDITFGADATFEGAITGVTYGGQTLTSNQYTVSSGKITLHPSAGDNLYLRTPGTANVVVHAPGYNSSTVSQTIHHGIAVAMDILQNIQAPLAMNGQFAQQPIIGIVDQYDNICSTDSLTELTATKYDSGNWTLTGTVLVRAINGVVTFSDLGTSHNTLVTGAQLSFNGNHFQEVRSLAVTLPESTSNEGPSGDNEDNSPTEPPQSNLEQAIVVVNGEKQNVGIESRTIEDGKANVKITVNTAFLNTKIDEAIKANPNGLENHIQIPILDSISDIATIQLAGDIVKKLEVNNFTISVNWKNIEYIIPAEEIVVSKIAEEFKIDETLLDTISVYIRMTDSDEAALTFFTEAVKSNGAELLLVPVTFDVLARTVRADGNIEEIKINTFSSYVDRVLKIPNNVNPDLVTTGIVFNAGGSYSHVPTFIYEEDGIWYASLKSLTNSAYSIIWSPITVKSVENHWSKKAVNDMASRLVIFNSESFEPVKEITRGDFAEYIVRGLGLYRDDFAYENAFKDVRESDQRALAIEIANAYGIVAGYTDGTFRPNAYITREEAMVMYRQAMNITKLQGGDPNKYRTYTDFDLVGGWAVSYVKDVVSANIFNGTASTLLSPKAYLSYAEAAQAIKNLLVESKLINH